MSQRSEAQRVHIQDLEQRLAEAADVIAAMVAGQVDSVAASLTTTPVLLAEAQAALRKSEARYRQIVETTNQGVWLIDAGHKTTFVNLRMAQMLGLEPAQVLGRSPAEFLDDVGRAALATRAHQPAHQNEIQFFRADGTSFWSLIESVPEHDSDGRYAGTFAMLMDITERKRAEAALRASETRYRRLCESGVLLIAISQENH